MEKSTTLLHIAFPCCRSRGWESPGGSRCPRERSCRASNRSCRSCCGRGGELSRRSRGRGRQGQRSSYLQNGVQSRIVFHFFTHSSMWGAKAELAKIKEDAAVAARASEEARDSVDSDASPRPPPVPGGGRPDLGSTGSGREGSWHGYSLLQCKLGTFLSMNFEAPAAPLPVGARPALALALVHPELAAGGGYWSAITPVFDFFTLSFSCALTMHGHLAGASNETGKRWHSSEGHAMEAAAGWSAHQPRHRLGAADQGQENGTKGGSPKPQPLRV